MVRYLNKTEFNTKIGRLYCIWEKHAGSTAVLFLGSSREYFHKIVKNIKAEDNTAEKILINYGKSGEIKDKVTGYLNGRIKKFNFKVKFLTGTPFQKKIWNAAASIPYGETASYREIAELAGFKKAWRAAGSALSKNPLLLIIPCHRIIKSNGGFGKFGGGEKLKVKKFLLNLEKN